MAEIYGESPRPMILVAGSVPNDSRSVDELLGSLPGTVTYLGERECSEVRQEDFDSVILFGDDPLLLYRELMVLQIGGTGAGEITRSSSFGERKSIELHGRGTIFQIENENIPDHVPADARKGLAQYLRQLQPHGLVYRKVGAVGDHEGITAFMREKDGGVCAGWWWRDKGAKSQWWYLPEGTPGLAAWFAGALSKWRELRPEAFPLQVEDWTQETRWMSIAERSAKSALDGYRTETRTLMLERTAEETRLAEELENTTFTSGDSERLLLTSQGRDLVQRVISTLRHLGFDVVDSDMEKHSEAYLLEDLRIRCGDWVALVEVRGYAKGAKTSDLQRIERAVTHYERNTGSGPDARWYIVNHNLVIPPDSRPLVLAGADDDIAVFSEVAGLVIDTRDLFKATQRVYDGAVSPERVRESLMNSSGRFELRNLEGED